MSRKAVRVRSSSVAGRGTYEDDFAAGGVPEGLEQPGAGRLLGARHRARTYVLITILDDENRKATFLWRLAACAPGLEIP